MDRNCNPRAFYHAHSHVENLWRGTASGCDIPKHDPDPPPAPPQPHFCCASSSGVCGAHIPWGSSVVVLRNYVAATFQSAFMCVLVWSGRRQAGGDGSSQGGGTVQDTYRDRALYEELLCLRYLYYKLRKNTFTLLYIYNFRHKCNFDLTTTLA